MLVLCNILLKLFQSEVASGTGITVPAKELTIRNKGTFSWTRGGPDERKLPKQVRYQAALHPERVSLLALLRSFSIGNSPERGKQHAGISSLYARPNVVNSCIFEEFQVM
jgi:hypothetical protein